MEEWLRAQREAPANPASIHRSGRRAQAVLEDARDRVAQLLRCGAREIVFTSGATESCNLALFGAARALRRLHGAPSLLIGSAVEHPAVLAPLRLLQSEGWPLRLLPVDATARVDTSALAATLSGAKSAIVAVQWANNETGAVQNLLPVAALASPDVHWHADAVQGVGKLLWDAALDSAQTLALSGHKIGAPKGVGMLRVSESALLDPWVVGGGQQRGRRAGTESPAMAAAFACALALALAEQETFAKAAAAICEAFLTPLRASGVPFLCNTPRDHPHLAHTLSLTVPGIEGRALLPACDAEGLDVSSGAACSSGAAQPSAVLLACGLDAAAARATVRISFLSGTAPATAREAGERFAGVARRLYEVAYS